MMTDSELLFNVISGNRYTIETRLMFGKAAVRESFNQDITTNIALIDCEYNNADVATKITHWSLLDQVMRTEILIHSVK